MEGMLLDPEQGKLLRMVPKHVLQVDQLLPSLPLLPVPLLHIRLHRALAKLPMMLLVLVLVDELVVDEPVVVVFKVVDKLDQQPHKRLLHLYRLLRPTA